MQFFFCLKIIHQTMLSKLISEDHKKKGFHRNLKRFCPRNQVQRTNKNKKTPKPKLIQLSYAHHSQIIGGIQSNYRGGYIPPSPWASAPLSAEKWKQVNKSKSFVDLSAPEFAAVAPSYFLSRVTNFLSTARAPFLGSAVFITFECFTSLSSSITRFISSSLFIIGNSGSGN